MSEALYERLQAKLAQAFADSWAHTQPGRFEFDPETRLRDDGSLQAGVRYCVQRSDSTWVEVHREPMTVMMDEAAVDDFIASGLSQFLMKHPSWPR